MKDSIERYVQRELNYAIVDEVDSILIDEARTPLIISGPAEQSADLYQKVNSIIPALRKDIDYTVDEKAHSAIMTDSGIERVEQRLNVGNLYNPENIEWLHHVTQALRAHTLYKRDVNYLIEEGKILIVDEFTGRKMPGRRWSDGLHQAIEAKEGVEVQEENQTLATISYQNYFRIYKKLAGMTGTADTEASEFHQIYKLDVTVVPTNKPMLRQDHHDLVYKNERGKFRAVLEDLEDCHARGQPVLVGTVSVEKSEVVASQLRKPKIPHDVLNAKQHEREAHIVAQAGRKGAITISTNMAGRGTDIILGGNPEFMARAEIDPEKAGQPGAEVDPEKFKEAFARYKAQCDAEKQEVLAAGGLHILGTERHESRRIDNQLRGRVGPPGRSRLEPLLPVAGRRPDAHLRRRAHHRPHGAAGDGGRRPDRAPAGQPRDRERAEEGRRPQLRHPQEPARVRRRHEPAAQDDLCAAPPGARGPLRARAVGRGEEEGQDRRRQPGADRVGPAHRRFARRHRAPDAGAHGRRADAGAAAARDARGAGAAGDAADDPARSRTACARRSTASTAPTPTPSGAAEDRTGTLDRLARDVASSLIQQRERLLDLCEEMLQAVLDEQCSARPSRRRVGPRRRSPPRSRSASASSRASTTSSLDREVLVETLWGELEKVIEAREAEFSLPVFLYFARYFYLEEIDQRWIDHLKAMEALREGIGLRGYGQKDPKQEYKKEGFVIFGEMMGIIGRNVCEKLFHMQLRREETAATVEVPQPQRKRAPRRTIESGGGAAAQSGGGAQAAGRRAGRGRGAPGAPPRAQGRPQRSLPLRQRQEIQEVPRSGGGCVTRVGRRAGSLIALVGLGGLVPPACQTSSQPSSCDFQEQAAEPASPLTMLSTARLDRVGSGFLLLGSDAAAGPLGAGRRARHAGRRGQRAAAADDGRPVVRRRRSLDAR